MRLLFWLFTAIFAPPNENEHDLKILARNGNIAFLKAAKGNRARIIS